MLVKKIKEACKQFHISKAYIMIYFYDQVVLGKVENEVVFIPVTYNDDLWYEIHLFNQEMELRCTREHEDFIQIVSGNDYFEEEMFIIGNTSEVKEGYSIIRQNGRKVIVPFEVEISNGKHDLSLVVHHLFSKEGNYIECYRLVDIKGGNINV